MNFRNSAAIAIATAMSIWPVLAQAVTYDHLECYQVETMSSDKTMTHTLDLTPSQTEFLATSGCSIRTKSKTFCIDVQKSNVSPAPLGEEVHAGNARNYFCYKLKCPEVALPTLPLVVDQFGRRSVVVKKADQLCVPADTHLPGWLRQDPLETPDALYWTDTDGVAPETPGCHIPWKDPVGEATCAVRESAPEIGEVCLTEDELLETNPGAGVCHSHKGYEGHPDVYSCDGYCAGLHGPAFGGTCVAVASICNGATTASAKCECAEGVARNQTRGKSSERGR
jgi:hypothetical protein